MERPNYETVKEPEFSVSDFLKKTIVKQERKAKTNLLEEVTWSNALNLVELMDLKNLMKKRKEWGLNDEDKVLLQDLVTKMEKAKPAFLNKAEDIGNEE